MMKEKNFKTEGHKKDAKYWPQGRCGKKGRTLPMAGLDSYEILKYCNICDFIAIF